MLHYNNWVYCMYCSRFLNIKLWFLHKWFSNSWRATMKQPNAPQPLTSTSSARVCPRLWAVTFCSKHFQRTSMSKFNQIVFVFIKSTSALIADSNTRCATTNYSAAKALVYKLTIVRRDVLFHENLRKIQRPVASSARTVRLFRHDRTSKEF